MTTSLIAMITATIMMVMKMTNQDKFSYRWMQTCEQLGVSYAVAIDWCDRLVEVYSMPHRRYHTIDHIVQMFDYIDGEEPTYGTSPLLDLAVFFHDACYAPWRDMNEADSASYAVEFCKEARIECFERELVRGLILATKGHEKPSHSLGNDRRLYTQLIDADLSILASPMNDFVAYEDGISKEFEYLGRAKYLDGRVAFLNGLLNRGYIFPSYWGSMFGDKKARDNIEWLVGKLQNEQEETAAG